MDETILTSSGTTSCSILQEKVNSGLPRGLLLKPVQQRAHYPDERLCTWNCSRILLVQSQLVTPQASRTWITCCQSEVNFSRFRPPSSSYQIAEGDNQLKDIVVKKFCDEKPDDPRLGFCDFLKVEVVQLTSDSYDEFQQETFKLLMRLKHRDKQQQRFQHGMGTSMAQTVTYSQASMSHHHPVPHTQMHQISRCNRIYTCNTRAAAAAATVFTAAAITYTSCTAAATAFTACTAALPRHSLSLMHPLSSRSTDTLHSKVCNHSNTCYIIQ